MIKTNLENVQADIPEEVTLVAVSKTKPNELIMEAYNSGQRIFGENRVQELVEKEASLPKDIKWHMIGHLQSKKVKKIAPFVDLIHAIDSLKLLSEVNKQALNNNRIIDVLIQFHIAGEESKFGLTITEAEEILSSDAFSAMKNVRIVGVMGMATFTDNMKQVRQEFKELKNYFDILKSSLMSGFEYFKEISMGMSGDFRIAIEEGGTMVRIGSTIFGSRS